MEEFCKRGYAVIHLKREGSVAPFGRILASVLKCGRGGPNFDSLGELFDCGEIGMASENDEDCYDSNDFGLHDITTDDKASKKDPSQYKQSADPWMYSNQHETANNDHTTKPTTSKSKQRGELSLNHRIVHSHILQSTLRAYKTIKHQGMLLTIDFRTVDEYLHKLKYCSEAINICGSLALVYLAAAVSDFYIPEEKKALHKIQSRDYGIKSQASSSSVSSFGGNSSETEENNNNTMQIRSDNTLTLTLYPVPKVIPSLRKRWCPSAFVISFKLETDSSILQQKSVLAMERNGVHLVIGNELATRYEKVFVLSQYNNDDLVNSSTDKDDISGDAVGETSSLPKGYHIAEVTAAHGYASGSENDVDALEYATIEYVVRHHFHYISTNIDGAAVPNLTSAAEMIAHHTHQATLLHEKRLTDTYRQLQRERLKARISELAMNIAGSALGMALSYGIALMLQGRQRNR